VTFLLGVVVGVGLAAVAWLLMVSQPARHVLVSTRETDEALIVKALQAYGAMSVLNIQCKMDDLTRGEHNWMLKSDRSIFKALARLEAAGAVASHTNRIDGRVFTLVASPEKLVNAD